MTFIKPSCLFKGSYSSITETAETTGANSDTVTWTESQVTVLSADVGVGATDKISPSSLATSFGRTESLSSEHLFKVESDGCASSKGRFKELFYIAVCFT